MGELDKFLPRFGIIDRIRGLTHRSRDFGPVIFTIPVGFAVVNRDCKTLVSTGFEEGFGHISVWVGMKWALFTRNLVVRGFRVPHAKSIVMLRRKAYILCSGFHKQICPLIRIESYGIELPMQILVIVLKKVNVFVPFSPTFDLVSA